MDSSLPRIAVAPVRRSEKLLLTGTNPSHIFPCAASVPIVGGVEYPTPFTYAKYTLEILAAGKGIITSVYSSFVSFVLW